MATCFTRQMSIKPWTHEDPCTHVKLEWFVSLEDAPVLAILPAVQKGLNLHRTHCVPSNDNLKLIKELALPEVLEK